MRSGLDLIGTIGKTRRDCDAVVRILRNSPSGEVAKLVLRERHRLLSSKNVMCPSADEEVLSLAHFIASLELSLKTLREEEVEYVLFNALSFFFGSCPVLRQVRLPDSSKIDIVLFDVGIEVKLLRRLRKGELDRAFGQIVGYKKYFRKLMLVVAYTDERTLEKAKKGLKRIADEGVCVVPVKVRKY